MLSSLSVYLLHIDMIHTPYFIYGFVFIIESIFDMRALLDVDYINALQDELDHFEISIV